MKAIEINRETLINQVSEEERIAQSVSSKRRRVRHHVNPLQIGITRLHKEGQPPLFESLLSPLEVEFGCADGEFLFQRADLRPEANYIGIEIREELVSRVNRRALRNHYHGVKAIVANLNADLPALFLKGQIDRIFINFPDPWFKKNQHKRRLVQLDWAEEIVSFLRPFGELFFQSDIFELALDALTIFEQIAKLQNQSGLFSFCKQNPYGAKSLREIRVEEKELPVWRILYKRVL